MKKLIICIFLLNFSFVVSSHNYQFKHLSFFDGKQLPTSYTMTYDNFGFLWFATTNGLCRYDGSVVKTFRNNPEDSTSISANWVITVYKDKSGNIWAGSLGGALSLYHPEKENFENFPLDSANIGHYVKNAIITILEDNHGILWTGSNGKGLFQFDRKSKKYIKNYTFSENDPNSISSNFIDQPIMDSSGNLWVPTKNGLNKYNRESDNFTRYSITKNSAGLESRIYSVSFDRKGMMWVGTENGAFKINSSDGKILNHFLPSSNVKGLNHNVTYGIYHDRLGQLWISVENNGIIRWNPETGDCEQFYNGKPNSDGFDITTVYHFKEAKNGLVWMTVAEGGIVSFYPEGKKGFYPFILNPSEKDRKEGSYVTGIQTDSSGNMWMGTENGVVRLEKNGKQTLFSSKGNSAETTASNYIWTVLVDRNNNIWAGTNNGLIFIDTKTGKLSRFISEKNNPNSLIGNRIMSLLQSSEGKIWIGSSSGISVYEPETKIFMNYKSYPDNPDSLGYHIVTSLFENSKKEIWIGTNGGGVFKYLKSENKFKRFQHNSKISSGLSSNSVMAIAEDKNGFMWFGTISQGGLNRLNADGKTFTKFTVKNGLQNDQIEGILTDDLHNLWVSTAEGISRISLKDSSVDNYDYRDGLNGNTFDFGGYEKDKYGNIYFCGNNGFTKIIPSEISARPYYPEIVFTGFLKYNTPFLLDSSITAKQIIELNYDDQYFSIQYSALEFEMKSKIKYAFKLEIYDEHWIENGSNETVTYTHLEPGNYVFKVKSTNTDGRWNSESKSIQLIVKPPFWKTWWFFLINGLMIAGSFAGTIRYISIRNLKKKIGQLEQERELRETREKTKEKIARDLHDDVSTTLSSMSLYLESAKNKIKSNPETSQQILEKLQTLSSQAKESMEEVVWSLSPKNDTLINLMNRMKDTAAELCLENGIQFETNQESDEKDYVISETVRKNIYLIFKEVINNSLKHSGASKISLFCGTEKENFYLTIKDDGTGTELSGKTEKSKGGNGLLNIKKRAQELNAELNIISSPNEGMSVEIRIEITQMCY